MIVTPESSPSSAASQKCPLEVGQRWFVNWRDGRHQLAEIVERRPVRKAETISSADSYDYYVHYVNFDRRLDEWVNSDRIDLARLPVSSEPSVDTNGSEDSEIGNRTLRQKRNYDEMQSSNHHGDCCTAEAERDNGSEQGSSHDELTKVKNINTIELGKYEIDTWYYSPYPEDYSNCDKLRICEYCLKYMRKRSTMNRHKTQCQSRSPPGREIYREGNLSVYEIDGKTNKLYCQNLCLLSKLFLDHKTLYFDVEPFIFYVLCEVDCNGAHIVGYFSKEKSSDENYNLACILTFPPYQRKGYGKFLISLSYELTKRDGIAGSPEKPLSDLGKLSYRSYWSHVLLTLISENKTGLSIKEMSRITGIKTDDIVSTFKNLNLIRVWKGQHVVYLNEEILAQAIKDHASSRIRLTSPENFINEQTPKRAKIGTK